MKINSIMLFLALISIASCSKSEQIESDLKYKLGDYIYKPKAVLVDPYMPDCFSLQNSYQDGDILQSPYFTDRVSIRKEGDQYILKSQKHTNPSKEFDMNVWSEGFELFDDNGNTTEYEKQ